MHGLREKPEKLFLLLNNKLGKLLFRNLFFLIRTTIIRKI